MTYIPISTKERDAMLETIGVNASTTATMAVVISAMSRERAVAFVAYSF